MFRVYANDEARAGEQPVTTEPSSGASKSALDTAALLTGPQKAVLEFLREGVEIWRHMGEKTWWYGHSYFAARTTKPLFALGLIRQDMQGMTSHLELTDAGIAVAQAAQQSDASATGLNAVSDQSLATNKESEAREKDGAQ